MEIEKKLKNQIIACQSFYVKIYPGINVKASQIVKDTYPLGPAKYKELMQKVTTEHIMDYQLDPQCRNVLENLYKEGFRFAVVTSRSGFAN